MYQYTVLSCHVLAYAACDVRGRELLRLVSLKTLSPCEVVCSCLRDLRPRRGQ